MFLGCEQYYHVMKPPPLPVTLIVCCSPYRSLTGRYIAFRPRQHPASSLLDPSKQTAVHFRRESFLEAIWSKWQALC